MVAATHLFDTNIWIYILKGRSPDLIARLGATDPKSIALCSVVKAELWYGANRYENRERRLALLKTLFEEHPSMPFDDQAAAQYGEIRSDLELRGHVIGPMDMLIAAIAMANQLTVVTNNSNEYRRIPNLSVENWTE